MTKELLDFHHLDELKNFATNIFLKLVSKPRIEICTLNWIVLYYDPCKGVSHILEICTKKGKKFAIRSGPIGY